VGQDYWWLKADEVRIGGHNVSRFTVDELEDVDLGSRRASGWDQASPGGDFSVIQISQDMLDNLAKCYEPPTTWAMRIDHLKRLKSRKMRWMMRVEKRKKRKRAARKRARKGGK
jgi:hypothetical protein